MDRNDFFVSSRRIKPKQFMAFTEILPGIHYVGVNDRTTTRFESLWSLPYGVSYNSYLVIDEKSL